MKADDPCGPQRGPADLGDRQRGGVGGQDRVTRRGGVELGEDRLLDLHLLGHRLDHEVHVAERLIGRGALDAPHDFLDLSLGLLGGDLAPLGQLAHLASRDVASLLQPRPHELLAYVLEHHRDPRSGNGLSDLSAHRPCTHHGGLEYEHTHALID
jgi:hypothetical protein